MKRNLILLTSALLTLCGCGGMKHSVIVSTGTVVGVSVSQNPATQLYEAKLGYGRAEFAYVPGNTNNPASVPDVMMEMRVYNIFAGGGIYQRLAVGKNAVAQPGASIMFAKDATGVISSNALHSITHPAIPALPGP